MTAAIERPENVRALVRKVLDEPRDRVALVLVAVTAIISSLLEAALLITITMVGLRIASDSATPVQFPLSLPVDELETTRLIGLGAVMLLVRLAVSGINLWINAALSASVLSRWRTRVVSAFLRASWERVVAEDDGHLQTVSETYVVHVAELVQRLGLAITAAVSFSTLISGAFALSPVTALGLFAFGGALFALLRPFTTRVRLHAESLKREGQEFSRQLSEVMATAKDIRLFGRRIVTEQRLQATLVKAIDARRRQQIMTGLSAQFLQAAGLGVVLGGLAIVVNLDLGEATLIGALVLLLVRSLSYGQTFYTMYQSVIGSAAFINGMLDAIDGYESSELPPGRQTVDTLGRLDLQSASLGYGSKIILSDVNISIAPGEAIGIVGPSGAGKSTFAAALLDIVRPLSGEYLAERVPVSDIDEDCWRSRVAFVPQDPTLIDGTVAENIDFYRGLSAADIERAANDAHLGAEIEQWDGGLSYSVGARGGRLSGGQKQRICIARALVGQPEVILFDEPTSALDVAAEDSITQVLHELRGARTMIVIAHRLTTLEFCDRILLVDNGVVVELGSGSDLQEQEGMRRVALKALSKKETS